MVYENNETQQKFSYLNLQYLCNSTIIISMLYFMHMDSYVLFFYCNLLHLQNKFCKQKSYKNFLHENFVKDRDTLMEQSVLQIIRKYRYFMRKYLAQDFYE